ncbi:MAG: hypothetical protein IJ677_01225 [Alphaproteobacteria bacterium]|nr:hypothetical protein [Alphaproteobacteria bacterium]
MGWKTIAKGITLTVMLSLSGKALAQTFKKTDALADRIKKEVKFTVPEITKENMAQFEIRSDDEPVTEVLQPKKPITMRSAPDTLINPRISDMNLDMPNDGTGHLYLYQGMLNGKEQVFAARFVDDKGNAWAVNLDMSPSLIREIDKAVTSGNDADILRYGEEIKKEQERARITDSSDVINFFETHCYVEDNSKFGLSYSQQRKLAERSPKDTQHPILTAQRVNE